MQERLYENVHKRGALLSLLQHDKIEAIHSFGLLMAVKFDNFDTNKKVIDAIIARGAVTDWFLFASSCLRICPPLTISEEEIKSMCYYY